MLLRHEAHAGTFTSQDLSKFFDTVPHGLLSKLLKWFRAPSQMDAILKGFHATCRRVISYRGMLDTEFISHTGRGLLQGCPFSPLCAALFMWCWSHFVRDAHVSLRAVSFVDDRSFWCKVAGDRAETIAWLLEAKRRSDAFDGCCGFECRPSKCHVASADVDLAFTVGQAMGYSASNFLELLGVGIDLTSGVCKLQSVSREALKARLRAIACLHCNPLDRAQLIRNLVITSLTWTAGIAVLGEDELVQFRGEVLSAFNPKARVDVPPVVSLELLGWCSDPVCASWRVALKAAHRFHAFGRRWMEFVGLDVGVENWTRLLPPAPEVLQQLGWWTTHEGQFISRRDADLVVRSFEVGVGNFKVLQDWLFDFFRQRALRKCTRVTRSHHRHEEEGLAQGDDLGAPAGGSLCLFEGHKRVMAAASNKFEQNVALVTGLWHQFRRLARGDPKEQCLCGGRLPSRLYLWWSCPATGEFRTGIRSPADRCEERLGAVPLAECPAPPPCIWPEDIHSSLCAALRRADDGSGLLGVATDGSSEHGVAAFAVIVPAAEFELPVPLPGQDQTPYRAEFEAVLLVCKCLIEVLRGGALVTVRKIVIVLDCLSVVIAASGHCQASPLLAQRFANMLREIRHSCEFDLAFVPSHGKQSNACVPHPQIGEAVMRAWNHRADAVAGCALRARLQGSRRSSWWRSRQRVADWEVQALGALNAIEVTYREFAARL